MKNNKNAIENILNSVTHSTTLPEINTSDVCPKNESDKKCAPGVNFDNGSCIKLHILEEMAIAYNKDTSSDKIKLHKNLSILNPKKYKKYLLNEFNKRLGDKCTTQKCWSEETFIRQMKKTAKEELEKYTFRPNGPEGKWEWLNTINIDKVMEQAEYNNKGFKFLGTVPIDFDKFERFGIKNLDFSELKNNGKTRLGIVFNLDEHDQSGSHWVSMYADIQKGGIYFFDSYGTKPEKRIRALMRRIEIFCSNVLGIKNVEVDYNNVRHQYGNSECGVYSINFIKRMLRGDSFRKICDSKISDEKVNQCRNVYFKNKV